MACSSDSARPRSIACLEARIDIGEFLAMVSAQRSAVAIRSFCGTTSLTKPSSSPSFAETCRAVRIMPMARFRPICRGSRCKPPASAARPTRGSGRANVALSEAMMRSQASAISNPPPIATPLTAAMIGLSQSNRDRPPPKPPLSQPRLPPAACHFRSLPAQNALSPAPVTIATHCSGSAAKSSKTLLSSKCASICSALYTSGRDRVTIVTGPLRVTLENFSSIVPPRNLFCGAPILAAAPGLVPSHYASEGRATSRPHCGDKHSYRGSTALDFNLPPDLVAYLDELDRFIAREIKPLEEADDNIRFFDHRREWARTDFDNGGLPRHEWEDLLAEMRRRADPAGHYRFALPREYGGKDGSNLAMAIIREHLAAKGLGLHNDLQNESSIVANLPIVLMFRDFGTEAQKRHFIPGMLDGSIRIAFGLTEPEHGSDATWMETRGVRETRDGVPGWRIDGRKMWNTGMHVASHDFV